MSWSSEPVTYKSKARRRCDWCWEWIEVGEQYIRYRWANDGDVGTCRMHPECHEAMEDATSHEGGYLEWTPGQDRPKRACDMEPQP
jgi:hypothetical protein